MSVRQKLQVTRDVTRGDLVDFCADIMGGLTPVFDAKAEICPTFARGNDSIVFRMGQKGVEAWKKAGKLDFSKWSAEKHRAEVVFSKDDFGSEKGMTAQARYDGRYAGVGPCHAPVFSSAGLVLSNAAKRAVVKKDAKYWADERRYWESRSDPKTANNVRSASMDPSRGDD